MAGETPNAGRTPVADEGSDVHARLRELQAQIEELQRDRDEVRNTLPPTPTYLERFVYRYSPYLFRTHLTQIQDPHVLHLDAGLMR